MTVFIQNCITYRKYSHLLPSLLKFCKIIKAGILVLQVQKLGPKSTDFSKVTK